MISTEEYLRAKKTVQEYNVKMSESLANNFKCSICVNSVEILNKREFDYLNQEKEIYKKGAVGIINFGYGSEKDGDRYYVAICDDCIETLEKEKIAINLKDVVDDIKEYKLKNKKGEVDEFFISYIKFLESKGVFIHAEWEHYDNGSNLCFSIEFKNEGFKTISFNDNHEFGDGDRAMSCAIKIAKWYLNNPKYIKEQKSIDEADFFKEKEEFIYGLKLKMYDNCD